MKAYLTILAASFILFPSFIQAIPVCHDSVKTSSQYENLQKQKTKNLKKFANSKEMAKKADATLSKLIKAKSPVIVKWMNKRGLKEASETQIAKRWRRYYAKNFVLRQYPTSSATINSKVEKLINNLYARYFPEKRKARFNKLFSQAKKQALKEVKSFDIPESAREKLTKRISKISIYWMEDFQSSKFQKKPLEVFSWGVAYDPRPNEINVGFEALKYQNKETLFAVFAHEIAHSFDPCRWSAFLKGQNPFKDVIQCLRTDKSIGAKKRDDSKMPEMVKKGKLSKSLMKALKLHPTCNKAHYPPIGVQADQALEAFADWFSAEVVAGTKYVTPNLRIDLCKEKDLNEGSPYPENIKRLKKIYFAQPDIKKALGADNKARYCGL